MTDWVYPDYFDTLTVLANWVATVSAIFCAFLLLSWTFLPVEKTSRHYLSVCLTAAVGLMNVSHACTLKRQWIPA
jgi:CHASE2 domain-containing sensor protein